MAPKLYTATRTPGNAAELAMLAPRRGKSKPRQRQTEAIGSRGNRKPRQGQRQTAGGLGRKGCWGLGPQRLLA
eukprot:11205529-Lingulodinium_polyedra.AAC.1